MSVSIHCIDSNWQVLTFINQEIMISLNRNHIHPILLAILLVSALIFTDSCKKSDDTNPPSGLTVTDIDGNVYHTVNIGSQVWMIENLKAGRYNDGTSIPSIPGNTDWYALTNGACCDYNNTPGHSITYGKLYNYFAITDSRRLCPSGWHVPTHAEWTALATFLGGEDVAGGKLKEAGFSHWMDPNSGADNSSGFTALPGGYRNNIGLFASTGYGGIWWSSSEESDITAWDCDITNNDSKLYSASNFKAMGISVRCIKD